MKQQAFYNTVNSVVEELRDNSFGVEILYGMCNGKLHPWGDKNRLGDKLCFISRLYRHELHSGFLKYDVHELDGKQVCRHRRINEFSAIRDMLWDSEKYQAFVEKISNINWKFAFDAKDDDIEHLKESFYAVLEFNDILTDAIQSYDELFDQPSEKSNKIPFASKFLHYHLPEQFFMYDSDLFRGRTYFRYPSGCRIGEAVIDNEAKSIIETTCKNVLKSMHGDGVVIDGEFRSPKVEYIRTMGLQYALCCYIKENSDKIDGLNQYPLPLISAEILTNVRKIKSEEDIEEIIKKLRPETPFGQLALYCEGAAELEQIAAVYMRRNNNE